MILRDPVHGLVEFEGDAERVVTALLETREVQRLRRVRQLGLTSLVFPGAEHSRFSHALGSAYVMQRLQRQIRRRDSVLPPELRLDDEAARDALAAALLHDLGHGPFSHLFEDVQPDARHHEEWTCDAIRDPFTEVHQALEGLSSGMSERVAGMLEGTHRLPYLARSVSGMLDVDRADYLLRDSHMTGVRYGLYDLDWLLGALAFGQLPSGDWVLAVEGRKGLPPIEGFFLGRHYMYQQVYHHKATRAAEALIRALFATVGERVRDGRPPAALPEAIRQAALGDAVTLGEYLTLDDPTLLSCFAQWERSEDATLAELARDLMTRRLPKTVPLDLEGETQWPLVYERACDVVRKAGGNAERLVWLDVASDTPYAESDKGLWVLIRHRPITRAGDASFLLGELRNKSIRRPRLIFPASLRREVLDAIGELLSGQEES